MEKAMWENGRDRGRGTVEETCGGRIWGRVVGEGEDNTGW
jgi:hypothetical protein